MIDQHRRLFRLLIKEVEGEDTAAATMMIVVVVIVVVVVDSGQEDEAGTAVAEDEGEGTLETVAAVQAVTTNQTLIGNKWRKNLPGFQVSHMMVSVCRFMVQATLETKYSITGSCDFGSLLCGSHHFVVFSLSI